MGLAKSGPEGARRDALAAMLNLVADKETVARLVERGVVGISAMSEEGLTILEAVVKRGGLVAMAVAYVAIKRLGAVLREGWERVRESVAAMLVTRLRIPRRQGLMAGRRKGSRQLLPWFLRQLY